MSRHVAWMEHPFGATSPEGIKVNLERAQRWFRWLLFTFPTVDFAADWILWCYALDDMKPEHRNRGLVFDDEMITRCDAAWYTGGRLTDGMRRGQAVAARHDKRIVDLTGLGDEPPAVFADALSKIIEALHIGGYKYQHIDEIDSQIALYASEAAMRKALAGRT